MTETRMDDSGGDRYLVMTSDTEYEQLERLIGPVNLEALITVAGGLSVYVPKRLPYRGRLSVLDLPAQRAMAHYYGGTMLYVPTGSRIRLDKRNEAIRAAREAGARVQDLARDYGLPERLIYAIVRARR